MDLYPSKDRCGFNIYDLVCIGLNTAWKVSVFAVFLVRIFPHLDWIRWDPYSVQMRENTDQKNSEYGSFSLSERLPWFRNSFYNCVLFLHIFNVVLHCFNKSQFSRLPVKITIKKPLWKRKITNQKHRFLSRQTFF